LLAVSTLAGIFALIGSWTHPFSRARDTANWLKKNNYDRAPLTGLPDVSFTSVAEEMQRPVYLLECGCVDTFKLFSKERESVDEREIASRLNLALERLGSSQILFVLYRPLDEADLGRLKKEHLEAEPLASFTGAEVFTENYYVYRIARKNQQSGADPVVTF
jgi:hypothetical protein